MENNIAYHRSRKEKMPYVVHIVSLTELGSGKGIASDMGFEHRKYILSNETV